MGVPLKRLQWQKIREQIGQRPRLVFLLGILVLVLAVGAYPLSRQFLAYRSWQRGQHALDIGNYEQAIASFTECVRISPKDPQTRLLLVRAHRLEGNYADAFKQLQIAEDLKGDVGLEVLLLDATSGKLEGAEQSLRTLLEANHPERRAIMEALIRGHIARQHAAEAERLATSWIEESPNHWQPWFLRGLARTQLSQQLLSTHFDQAKQDYQRVVELNPQFHLARFLLGNAYIMTGQYQEGLPYLQAYHDRNPDNWQGVTELANCYRGLGQVDEAQQVLDTWLKKNEGNLQVFLARGQVALDAGRPEEALDFYRRAEKLAPTYEKVPYHLARALRTLGRVKEATAYEEQWRTRQELSKRLKELEEVISKEPQNLAALHEAGTVALRLGDEAQGLHWLARVLQLDPNHRPTHDVLVNLFQQKGNPQAAAHHRRLAEQGATKGR